MPQTAPSFQDLADLIVGRTPRFDPAGRRIAVALYRRLAEGRPVSVSTVAGALGLPEGTVNEMLGSCTVSYDDRGAVTGFGGLTLETSPHTVRIGGKTLHTWCAWDALFIPGILGTTAEIASRDPVSGEPVSLKVGPDRFDEVRPETTVVSMLAPAQRTGGNSIENFCRFVHFFGSPETGSTWTAERPGTFLVSVADAFALGRLRNARHFGGALAPHPRPVGRTDYEGGVKRGTPL